MARGDTMRDPPRLLLCLWRLDSALIRLHQALNGRGLWVMRLNARRLWPSGVGGPGPRARRPHLLWAWVCWLELSLNHPYWHRRPDYPNWAPLSEKVCDLADWLTGGWCHD